MQTVKWERYPHVARNPATRAFIEEFAQLRRSPQTIDNDSRALEDSVFSSRHAAAPRVG